MRQTRSINGFTLVEALVVLAILAAMLLIMLPRLLWMLQSYYVKTAASQMAIHVRFARNECVTRKISYRIVINNKDASANWNSYSVEYDPQQDTTFEKVPNLDIRLPKGVQILSSAIFNGGIATINFNNRGAAIATIGTPPYEIDFQAVNGETYQVRVNNTGAVEVRKV